MHFRLLDVISFGALMLLCSWPCITWAIEWRRKRLKAQRLGGELYELRDGKYVEKEETSDLPSDRITIE
jgi:hypothetical protein